VNFKPDENQAVMMVMVHSSFQARAFGCS